MVLREVVGFVPLRAERVLIGRVGLVPRRLGMPLHHGGSLGGDVLVASHLDELNVCHSLHRVVGDIHVTFAVDKVIEIGRGVR